MIDVMPVREFSDVKTVLSHPTIWSSITSDGAPSPENYDWADYEKSLDDAMVIAGYINSDPVAILIIREYLDGSRVHIHVLPEFRKEHSREFGEKAEKFLQFPCYATIPDVFPNVQRFAEAFGFSAVDHYPSIHRKNGESFMVRRYKRAVR